MQAEEFFQTNETFKTLKAFGDYFVAKLQDTLTVFYLCPEHCARCNPFKECLQCDEGYFLEKNLCRLFDYCLEYKDNSFEVCE